ncbi:MAG: hypothetical protein GWQ08_01445 [Verrucomicrobiaceae bacterium]|nr:hypothetical protein [Verrucomicrobiaceae bacterium]
MPASNSAVETYLAKAARRRQWVEFGRQVVCMLWILGGLFLIWLLVARLSAVISDRHAVALLGGLPVVAGILAWFTHRRVSEKEAATVVDRYEGNHDLFLTAMHLNESSGDYQEQIRERAEAKASVEAPLGKMIPWAWQKPCFRLLGGLLVLVVALLFLPQLDPFGKEEIRDWLTKQEERLEELRKRNEEARALLKPEDTEQRGEEIAQALSKLEQTFQLARPEQQEATRKALRDQQKELGKFWQQLDDEKLTKALDKESDRWQKIGQTEASMSPDAKAMRDELREMLRSGDAKKLQDRLAEMLEKVEKQQQQNQSGESSEEQAALKDSLQELASAISAVSPSDPLKASLQRAIEQMQMAQNPDLQDQAMEGAQQSMEQLQKQIESLAEQLKQLNDLESGMDAAQLAQQLNELGQMSGQEPGGKGIKSYADLYKQLLAESQGGGGPGMRGQGTGEGGVAPEDVSLATGFKKEQSPSHLVAGKTLLQWQTKEASEAGQATDAYQESIQQLKQGLSEAIRQEKVPAGYHDQIQRYFDTLKEEPAPDADGLD